jgi:nicotinamide mononucleotide (NMN) deamidase PncC
MAIGAAQKSGAELGVGITGIAGPHAESQPAGTVYIAVANSEIQNVFVRRYLFQDHDRNIIRQKAVLAAMDLVTAVITSTGRQPHFAWSCSPAIIHTVTGSKTHSF